MRQFKNKTMLQLTGFEELLEKLQEAGKDIDDEGRKCFEACTEVVYDELVSQATKAGLPSRLVDEITDKIEEKPNRWAYEVGWKKTKPSANNLPDTYKVMFYNYGTPKRTTKRGYNRGEESPHPAGSHGFIKKAKLAARNKCKKRQKETFEKIMGDIQE